MAKGLQGLFLASRYAAGAALLVMVAWLPGCSDVALPSEEMPASGPDLSYNKLVANYLKSAFKNRASYDAFVFTVSTSWDKIGRLKKGVFLAHRSVHRREDETAFQFGEGSGREGRQGHRPGDTQAVFGGGKIRIVLEGLRGEDSIAELCRREGIAQNLYYRWSKDFLEAGKKRLAGDTARAATSDEVKDLRREATALKEVVADLTLENRLLKKSVTADGEDEA